MPTLQTRLESKVLLRWRETPLARYDKGTTARLGCKDAGGAQEAASRSTAGEDASSIRNTTTAVTMMLKYQIFIASIALAISAALDMATTMSGISTGCTEANYIALVFQQRYGVLEGMIARELLVAVPLAIAGTWFLHHRTRSVRIASLAVWVIALAHVIATINNVLIQL